MKPNAKLTRVVIPSVGIVFNLFFVDFPFSLEVALDAVLKKLLARVLDFVDLPLGGVSNKKSETEHMGVSVGCI